MGGRLSKKGDISTMSRLLMSMPHAADLSSDETMPQLEPKMQNFGNKCLVRSTLGEYEVYAVDFKYLNEAITHLLEGNHEVVKMEFHKKNQLSELVTKYFTYCASLEECLKKANQMQLAVNIALGQSEQRDLVRCLRSSKEFENFMEYFQTHLMMTQDEISKKLQSLDKKVKKKLRYVKRWKKAYTITFAAVSMAVPFLGIASAILAPPLATAQVQASTIFLQFIDKWFDSFCKGKEKKLKGKEKMLKSMELKNAGVLELNTILNRIYEVGIEFEYLFQNADLGKEDTAEKKGEILKTFEDLCKQVDKCNSSTRNARKGVLNSIIEDPLN